MIRHFSMGTVLSVLVILTAALLFGPLAPAQADEPAEVAAEGEAALDEAGHDHADHAHQSPLRAEFCAICDAKQRFRQAVPWLELAFDLRHRMIYDINRTLDADIEGHERFWLRERARLGARITPVKELEINARLVFEPRYYIKPETLDPQFIREEALFDVLNVSLPNIGGSGVTVTVGRQELNLGDGWLVREGTPRDGTRTHYFDAARVTVDAREIKTLFDVIFIYNHADSAALIEPFNDQDLDLIEHDEIGGIVYASNKSVPNHTIDAYFMYRNTTAVLANGFDSELFTVGMRVEGKPTDHVTYSGELAGQMGTKNGDHVGAYGFIGELSYDFHDKLHNSVRVGYEFRSGGEGSPNGSFDSLWGRQARWSNLFNSYVDTLEGPGGMSTNLHRISVGWTFNPAKKLSIATDYHVLFADENNLAGTPGFSSGGKFRGQLVTSIAKYVFNEHVSMHLIGELFAPGDYYDSTRDDIALFFRWELYFQW
jgi:hypothetical protein